MSSGLYRSHTLCRLVDFISAFSPSTCRGLATYSRRQARGLLSSPTSTSEGFSISAFSKKSLWDSRTRRRGEGSSCLGGPHLSLGTFGRAAWAVTPIRPGLHVSIRSPKVRGPPFGSHNHACGRATGERGGSSCLGKCGCQRPGWLAEANRGNRASMRGAGGCGVMGPIAGPAGAEGGPGAPQTSGTCARGWGLSLHGVPLGSIMVYIWV